MTEENTKAEKMTEEDATVSKIYKNYQCHICSEDMITFGDNFCSCCGTQLEWDD